MKCVNSAGFTRCDCARCAGVNAHPKMVSASNAAATIVALVCTDGRLNEQERVALWLAGSYIDSLVGEKLSES